MASQKQSVVGPKRSRSWQQEQTMIGRVLDWSSLCIGIVFSFLICRITMGTTSRYLLWSIVLSFYFLFYRRMVFIIYWSYDTYRFFRQIPEHAVDDQQQNCAPNELPHFHILIAAYRAGHSIGPVLKAIACQDYPKGRYDAWVITERSEQLAVNNQIHRVVSHVVDPALSVSNREKWAPFLWRCFSDNVGTIESWIELLTSGDLRSLLCVNNIWPTFIKDLLSRLIRIPNRTIPYLSRELAPLLFTAKEIRAIYDVTEQIESQANRLLADFARILGTDNIYTRSDLENHLIQEQAHNGKLKEIGMQFCRRFANPALPVAVTSRETAERVAKSTFPCTQSVVQQYISRLSDISIRHLDPHKRGPKPGALNAAYRTIKEEGLLDNRPRTHFVIVDADSLLPVNALKTIAAEIGRKDSLPVIMQMAAVPTANFFSGNWFSKFVSFADAIGAVGKWARSTRKQLKPDLHAGSGVVVPARLSKFIEEETGHAWDETTLTEDARLIIGQFGMMNQVRHKTRAVPIYLLEAVPEGDTFASTYQSFWNQRRRWTVGGYDEFFYMLGSPGWLRNTRFDSSSCEWQKYEVGTMQSLASRLRQLHRLALWCWDHFMWGIGGLIVMTHWWLISVMVISPARPIAYMGLGALLIAPLVFLSIPGRQLSWFIPGGLSSKRMWLLYFQAFVAIWLYCLPTVATQLSCILGFRAKIIEWKPTQKPRYQAEGTLETEEV